MAKKTAESRSENYSRNQLKMLGWNLSKVSNGGDCLEKQELNNLPIFKDYQYRPEFVLCIEEKPVVVIECKASCKQIDLASNEAKQYSLDLGLPIAIGVAGNEEDGVIVENWYYNGTAFEQVTFHNINLSQILSKKYVNQLIKTNKSELDFIDFPDENRFYIEAESIHSNLRVSGIDKSNMGIYLATIILAFYSNPKILSEESFDDLELINTLAQKQLRKFNKEDLIKIFNIPYAEKKEIHSKLKQNIPFIISSLKRLDVLPLLESDLDILGKFFETFLRYSNDKKELGIVFTPRHITDFMCELAGIEDDDKILDPCCGTGGFLVSAFSKLRNKLKEKTLSPEEYDKKMYQLKSEQLYGIEEESSGKLYGLACLNMIFRGVGHTNITHRDCFKQQFDFKFNKILINPPYAQKKNNKNGRHETDFLEYSLKNLEKGGVLCAIVPYSIFSESNGDDWRRALLKQHRVLASISVPETLFYPASAPAIIVVIEAHIPQKLNDEIFFARLSDDGYDIDRNKRTKKRKGQQNIIIEEFLKWKALRQANIKYQINKEEFIKVCKIKSDNYLLELVPEAYLESKEYSKEIIAETLEYVIKEQLGFQLKFSNKLIKNTAKINDEADLNVFFKEPLVLKKKQAEKINLKELFVEKKGGKGRKLKVYCSYGKRDLHSKDWLSEGDNIVISSGGVNNGLYGFYNYKKAYKKPILTCPSTGSIGEAFVQELSCSVDDNTLFFELKENIEIEILYYIATILRLEMWRYRYGRQISPPRLNELEIDMSYYDRDKIKHYRKNFPLINK